MIAVIGVVTHNRPTALVSCIDSYVSNCRKWDRAPEVVVMDDGDGGGADTRSVLQTIQARTGAPVRYAGLAEKGRYAEALARQSSVPRDVVDFALFGDPRARPCIGANRNGLLLDTVGALLFSADDDTAGCAAALGGLDDAVDFSHEYEPREFHFFPTRRAARDAAPAVDIDVLGANEALLGRTVTQPDGRQARVLITIPGIVGDSGMGSPRFFLTLTGDSRVRLLASADGYASALRSREVVRTPRRVTIADTPFCMTTFLGLDNRDGLPPFFPVARNSDGIFGLTVRRAFEDSRVAFLPSLLLHAPLETRAFAGDEAWTEPARVRMADVLIATIAVHRPGEAAASAGNERVLQRIGSYLREVGALDIDDFTTFVASAQQLRNLTLINLLESRLREYGGAPDLWADDVRRTIDLLRLAPASRDYVAPRDLGGAATVADASRLSRELVSKFGRLLEAWPSLIDAARRLRDRGERVSEPVTA